MDELDLVDEMMWEDCDKVEFVTLEEAGLENADCDTIGRAMHAYFVEEQ